MKHNKITEGIDELKKKFDKLDFLIKKQSIEFSREIRKIKRETAKWARLYCKEIGMIVDKDPLDEVFK